MVAVPILSGIEASGADFTTSYPVNLVPVPKVQGISQGYLRPADGIIPLGTGAGQDRGGFNWNDTLYRVMGTQFVSISEAGVVTNIGTVPGSFQCTFTASFDRMAICNGAYLYYWDGGLFSQVTDVDLGVALDVEWIDGYFMTTDGEFLVVTELADPFAVNPLKYGSSEINPDPVVGLQKIRNEILAINRYTIEIFDNIGGTGFPFARVEGAQIMKGAVGTNAACEFMQQLAFVGGGFNEPPAVWVGASSDAQRVSSREIDDLLRSYDVDILNRIVLESRVDRGHEFLLLHLPDKTLQFDGNASAAIGQPVWSILQSNVPASGYRARGMTWCYNRWNVGDPFGNQFGYLTTETGAHYGDVAAWEFVTPIIYNNGLGVQIHEVELIALTGNVAIGDNPLIATSYSLDGETWSQSKYINAGRYGQRGKRLVWYFQGSFRNWRVQKFTGDTRAHLAFARLEVRMEQLNA